MRALVVVVLVAIASVARAGNADLDRLIDELGKDDSAAVAAAVTALGERSEPEALAVLVALSERKLRVDGEGKVVFSQAAGLETPVVDNAIRRVLTPAIARARLGSTDVDERRAAAAVLAKGPAADLVPFVRARAAADDDGETRARLRLALAHGDLDSPDPALRQAAAQAVGAAGAIGFKGRLEALVESEKDPAVKAALADALSSIVWREKGTRVVRDVTYGLSQGSILLLVAIGLAITFGLMGVINMAHGEMLMLGAYTTFVVQKLFLAYLPGALGWYLVAAVPAAFAVCFGVGVLLERVVIRHLYGRPLETLLATWGLSLILIQTVRIGFGAQNVSVANPAWLSGGWELMDGVVLPYTRVATIGFAAFVVGFVALVLARTPLGLQVRAVMQNRAMARNLGVPTGRVDALTFGVGSAIAGLGGVALSQIGNVGPEMGQLYIVDSFMVVVVGGVGKLIGTVLAAFGLGMLNKLLEPMAGAVMGKIMVLGGIILFIQWRPQGLFAPRGRASEA